MSSMLRDTLYRLPRQPGLQLLQRRGDGGARELTTWRLRLAAGADHRFSASGEESVLVVQRGAGSVTVAGQTFGVSRKDVFEEAASAVYAPPNEPMTVVASSDFESVVVSTPAARHGSPVHVTSRDVRVNARGRGNYAREVHDIFVNDSVAQRIMVGETFNPAGHWSSFPPHKHDGRDGEPKLEEVYCYRVDPPQGFGHQMLYTADGEAVTHIVRDGDVVLLPYGYHPVSAPPGYKLYYLWAIAGEERRLALHEDPVHKWIHEIAD
jgi:5-deoxy-glucuronate isomerase